MVRLSSSTLRRLNPSPLKRGSDSLYDPELAAEPPSRVTWELEEQPGGITTLTLVHDELENSPKTASGVSGGWMFVISGLKTVVETGEPLAPRSTGAAPAH